MNISKINKNSYNRIPYYYYYICEKKEKGIEKISAAEIASDFGFKSATSIIKDFKELIDAPGRPGYGFNIVFLHRCFSKLMNLQMNLCKMYIVGVSPFSVNNEVLRKYKFEICCINEKFDINDIEEKEPSLLILFRPLTPDEFHLLEDTSLGGIINFTNKEYESSSVPVYQVDFLEILLNGWFQLSNQTTSDSTPE